MKAQYDYEATSAGELSIKEDQTLLVFGTEEEGWLLVQAEEGGRAGYVPANYVEEVRLYLSQSTPTLTNTLRSEHHPSPSRAHNPLPSHRSSFPTRSVLHTIGGFHADAMHSPHAQHAP